jgi:hypothetical protein
MSAREIIATTYIEGKTGEIGHLHADAIIQMLTAAGYRIVGPDEVDPVTVERCVAEMEANWGHVCTPELRDAIRSLKKKEGGE